jgi:hypothetical protein
MKRLCYSEYPTINQDRNLARQAFEERIMVRSLVTLLSVALSLLVVDLVVPGVKLFYF